MNAIEGLEGLQTRAADLIRQAYRLPHDSPQRTPLFKEVAETLVAMREHYLDAHGLPDWRGATYAYKRAVSSIYASAGLDRAAQATISAAIRYHVSAAVRERLDDETLDDLGLRRTSFRERSVAKREQQSALISALSPTPSDDAPAMKLHPLRAATGAYTLLSRITAEEVADLSPGVAARLQELVEDIADEVDRLREG